MSTRSLRGRLALCGATLAFAVTAIASPSRADSEFDREIELLGDLLEIREGAVIADLGAGDGDYAIALSRSVGPGGTVYATEIGEDERAEIAAAAAEAGADRVVVEAAQVRSTGLPPHSCDGAYMRGVYHHLTDPEPFAASLFETLRPGGRLVIIDFPPTWWLWLWTPDGIPEDRGGHGIVPEIVVRELEAAGFRPRREIAEWPSSNFVTRDYALVFERPGP